MVDIEYYNISFQMANATKSTVETLFSKYSPTIFESFIPEQNPKRKVDFIVELRKKREAIIAQKELIASGIHGSNVSIRKVEGHGRCFLISGLPNGTTVSNLKQWIEKYNPIKVESVEVELVNKRVNVTLGFKDKECAKKFVDEFSQQDIEGEKAKVRKIDIKDKKCFVCGKKGHLSGSCPEKEQHKVVQAQPNKKEKEEKTETTLLEEKKEKKVKKEALKKEKTVPLQLPKVDKRTTKRKKAVSHLKKD
ncbi:hypothetical protein EIN_035700 [Entamoeba invadens IP1]|uniref:CCHC-type domain-containing protein n=1 Tax=Entamoeba invadens IP1 TaxID=370355 RepID=A0A0A1TXZ2_ENTIV|nr:hypothetical protein EIN_035700 [Entamoeba invadens IP1]ELP86313.1 hypothetical protein EIN_035700 [Entamoeba invadens IP1]|eukprot:XP_004185659.1 hypothetical protein EIN_035700 [Entamoeba invadens IP1]